MPSILWQNIGTVLQYFYEWPAQKRNMAKQIVSELKCNVVWYFINLQAYLSGIGQICYI